MDCQKKPMEDLYVRVKNLFSNMSTIHNIEENFQKIITYDVNII